MKISLEIRPRLGVAVLTLKDITSPSILDCTNPDLKLEVGRQDSNGGDIIVMIDKITQNEILRIKWPKKNKSKLDPGLVHMAPNKVSDNQILIRINLGFSGKLEFMKLSDENRKLNSINNDLRNWSSTLKWPKCVQKDAKGIKCHIQCTRCEKILSNPEFKLERCLPLPSISWREFSQDWFCGCSSNKIQTDASGAKVVKVQEGFKDLAGRQGGVQPRSGDILFAPGFVCLNAKDLDSSCHVENKNITCSNCGHSLGHMEGQSCQIWQHCIKVGSGTKCDIALTSRETFLDLFCGVMSECPEKSSKIFFKSTDSCIMLWVLDQDIKFYSKNVSDNESKISPEISLDQTEVIKVMFQFFEKGGEKVKEDLNSYILKVSPEVLEAAKLELLMGQDWMISEDPKTGSPGDLQLSYINK